MKSFLLIFSLPCLKGILKEEALEHYALLVKSAYTLLKIEISEEELNLLKFLSHSEMLYGKKGMTFNLHSLIHAVQSVRNTGPFCSNSAFPFEGNIFTLKSYSKGPKGMDRQKAIKNLQSLIFKTGNTKNLLSSEEVSQYCTNLFTPKRLTTFYQKNEENVTFVGKRQIAIVDREQVSLFKKCIFEGKVYHSVTYSRATKTDDTVMQLKSGEYGRIL